MKTVKPSPAGVAAALGYVASIYTANWLISTYGLVHVLFGLFNLSAPAGVFAAGACLTLRNIVQDKLGRRVVVAAIVIGALLSWVWADPHIALASGVTFLVAEACDMAVYTPMRARGGWTRAVLAGNLVGVVVDSFLFLYLAGLLTQANFVGQLVGKYLWATLLVVGAVTVYRAVRRRVSSRRVTAVYLAGPINGCSDIEARGWRAEATRLLTGGVLDPMARDYRGLEDLNVDEIVEGDKNDIDNCAAVLAYCPKPSVGTSMEILYAHTRRMPVVVVVPSGAPVSPWLRYHATQVVSTITEAVDALRAVTT